MKHFLNEIQKEMFLKRMMKIYGIFKKDTIWTERDAYKTALIDFCDGIIFVSSEMTYDMSQLRNDLEEALDIEDMEE